MTSCIAFDIELADIIDLAPGEDLNGRGPFRIACAAAYDGNAVTHWYGRDAAGEPDAHMAPADVHAALMHLRSEQEAGARLVAWNGLAFDLRWMGVAAQDLGLARHIALDLYDPMFQLFVERGFPVALAKVARGFHITEGKSMDGAAAPHEWQAGNRQSVLDYVAQDCRLTEQVFGHIERTGELRWISARGEPKSHAMPALHPVCELLDRPLPDTSWMTDPWPRSKFTGWLDASA
ncbi:hypothetical protein Pla163_02580 [Planctomycetes bacterium Pla163]|uniref:Uncharacterized protein n=1 Tax=Rohdeia mirabilis TaxID=2528008 RepID=A0A518CVC2_9BACT|nr:hypothetical protein Pla163_02580 [Planctomycetes bacterium Pla163]